MKTKLKTLLTLAALGSISLLGLWHWQATYAERLKRFRVPKWIAGSSNTSYSIAIHKSQIKPYGTVWEMTTGDGWISNFPIYDDKDPERYRARHK